jgi:hypothetical protein
MFSLCATPGALILLIGEDAPLGLRVFFIVSAAFITIGLAIKTPRLARLSEAPRLDPWLSCILGIRIIHSF